MAESWRCEATSTGPAGLSLECYLPRKHDGPHWDGFAGLAWRIVTSRAIPRVTEAYLTPSADVPACRDEDPAHPAARGGTREQLANQAWEQYRAQRNAPPEVRADGSATEAELTRMRDGHEPGVWRSTGTAENDPWNDSIGPPLDPAPETAFGSASGEQKTRMFTMFGGLKMRERDKQVAFIEEVTGVRVNSRNDLSVVQAATVLLALQERSGSV